MKLAAEKKMKAHRKDRVRTKEETDFADNENEDGSETGLKHVA